MTASGTTRNTSHLTRLLPVALVVLALPAKAQREAPANTPTPRHAAAAVPYVQQTAAPNKPGVEGIHISGHWVLDVVNRDGTVAQHRDFENALQVSQASEVLANVMTGKLLPQLFYVALSGPGVTALVNPAGTSCYRTPVSGVTLYCATNLTQTVAHPAGAAAIVLKGTFTATTDMTFQIVATDIGTCPQLDGNVIGYSPAVCQATTSGVIPGSGGAGVGIYHFTAATIPDLPIAAEQSLRITVTISFS